MVTEDKLRKMKAIKLIKYMESDEYKDWFSDAVYKLFLKILTDMQKEDFTLEEAIECLEELLKE